MEGRPAAGSDHESITAQGAAAPAVGATPFKHHGQRRTRAHPLGVAPRPAPAAQAPDDCPKRRAQVCLRSLKFHSAGPSGVMTFDVFLRERQPLAKALVALLEDFRLVPAEICRN
jgi:hypothetical protein